jgi:hypothetical protein
VSVQNMKIIYDYMRSFEEQVPSEAVKEEAKNKWME